MNFGYRFDTDLRRRLPARQKTDSADNSNVDVIEVRNTAEVTQRVHAQPEAEPIPLTVAQRLGQAFSCNGIFELAVIIALFVAYNIVRALPHVDPRLPFEHARDIIRLEGPLFDHLELPLNHWLSGVPAIAVISCYFYAVFHYVATPTIFLLSRKRGGTRYWYGYWAIIVASGLALVVYALYPTAPPRLVPNLDIVDVMRQFASYGWWGNAASAPRAIGDATNQFAAMPSMHVGWALWCSIQMWSFGSWVWKFAAILYPTVLSVVVMGTGNHFILDIVGGVVAVGAAYAVVHLISATFFARSQPSTEVDAREPVNQSA